MFSSNSWIMATHLSLLLAILSRTTPSLGAPALSSGLSRRSLDTASLAAQYFGNDSTWYESRIPFFDSSDTQINEVYYYRWQVYRAHQRDLGELGFISTEFLDDVSWQLYPYASLNDATGFHLGEGRWNRDRRYKDDYLNYMYASGGNDRHFTDYMANAAWHCYLVDGDKERGTRYVEEMKVIYDEWADHLDTAKGLYWVEPLLDATEYTISSIDASRGLDGFTGGEAFRTSINSYQYANARAIAQMAELSGQNQSIVDNYTARADALKILVQTDLWNITLQHFIDRYEITNDYVTYWDPIRGRELVGLLPWMFDLVDDSQDFAAAWSHIINSDHLGGPEGLRTVEPSYEYYMVQYRYAGTQRECQWNGPTWPFQTTQVLIGMANLLDHYNQTVVTRSDYMRLLHQYTQLHYQGDVLNIEEDYDSATGEVIVGLARSPHYFHSGYIDLIITGVVGIRPRTDDYIEINPLLPASDDGEAIAWFRAEEIPYHGANVAVQWDADGSHFGEAGLRVERDGVVIGTSSTLKRLVIPYTRKAVIAIDRPISKSVQLQTYTEYPLGNASSGTDVDNVHDAIDGRVWFFSELPNGWVSDAGSTSDQWYSIDFGAATEVSRAEIAFFSDGTTFEVPTQYTIQFQSDGPWMDIADAQGDAPLSNGITNVKWSTLTVAQIRLAFTQAAGMRTRLVEFKVF
ncbi:glycogen debranching enzyme [Delphinella strobiligena]|nr:glycogen debranching enzyme [Delphinella strobiligena]